MLSLLQRLALLEGHKLPLLYFFMDCWSCLLWLFVWLFSAVFVSMVGECQLDNAMLTKAPLWSICNDNKGYSWSIALTNFASFWSQNILNNYWFKSLKTWSKEWAKYCGEQGQCDLQTDNCYFFCKKSKLTILFCLYSINPWKYYMKSIVQYLK